MYISKNAGTTWVEKLRTADIPVDKYYAIKLLENRGVKKILLATSNGVYSSINDGATWNKISGLPNVKVSQIHLVGDFLYAITFGRGAWKIPIQEIQP